MTNLDLIETLRTKEELINYFKEMGKTITEEEIETLKKSYKLIEANNGTLTLQQLNDVAGGGYAVIKYKKTGEVTHQVLGSTTLCEFKKGAKFFLFGHVSGKETAMNVHPEITKEQAKEMANNPDYLPVRVDDSRTKTSIYHFIPLQAEILKDPSIVQDFHLEQIFKELKKSSLPGIHWEQFKNLREALHSAGYEFAKLEITRGNHKLRIERHHKLEIIRKQS